MRRRIGIKPFAVIAGLVIVYVAWWWFWDPQGSSSTFSGLQTETSVSCDISHDGFLYAASEDTVALTPGESFEGRFGPHDVELSFLDEPGKRGLEIRRSTRSFPFSWTSGGSFGTENRERSITTGLGLGTLEIVCEH